MHSFATTLYAQRQHAGRNKFRTTCGEWTNETERERMIGWKREKEILEEIFNLLLVKTCVGRGKTYEYYYYITAISLGRRRTDVENRAPSYNSKTYLNTMSCFFLILSSKRIYQFITRVLPLIFAHEITSLFENRNVLEKYIRLHRFSPSHTGAYRVIYFYQKIIISRSFFKRFWLSLLVAQKFKKKKVKNIEIATKKKKKLNKRQK